MESQKNQREVENRFRESLRHDRARVQIGKISRFGLMELSRQRLQPSLEETAHISCPRCGGTGFIRGTESTALHVLRIIQEEAMKENTGAVHAQVPVDVASFLLNEKRAEIQKLEARIKVNIVLVPNSHLETPHYKIQRLKHDELNQMEHVPASYEMVEQPEEPTAPGKEAEREEGAPAGRGTGHRARPAGADRAGTAAEDRGPARGASPRARRRRNRHAQVFSAACSAGSRRRSPSNSRRRPMSLPMRPAAAGTHARRASRPPRAAPRRAWRT